MVGSTTFQNSLSKRGGSSATALNLFVADICALTCLIVELFRNKFQKRQCPMVPGSISPQSPDREGSEKNSVHLEPRRKTVGNATSGSLQLSV